MLRMLVHRQFLNRFFIAKSITVEKQSMANALNCFLSCLLRTLLDTVGTPREKNGDVTRE